MSVITPYFMTTPVPSKPVGRKDENAKEEVDTDLFGYINASNEVPTWEIRAGRIFGPNSEGIYYVSCSGHIRGPRFDAQYQFVEQYLVGPEVQLPFMRG